MDYLFALLASAAVGASAALVMYVADQGAPRRPRYTPPSRLVAGPLAVARAAPRCPRCRIAAPPDGRSCRRCGLPLPIPAGTADPPDFSIR